MNDRKRILTGVRPAGPPHVGHYAGAIESWLTLQHEHDCDFQIAYWQVSDHAGGPCPSPLRSTGWPPGSIRSEAASSSKTWSRSHERPYANDFRDHLVIELMSFKPAP